MHKTLFNLINYKMFYWSSFFLTKLCVKIVTVQKLGCHMFLVIHLLLGMVFGATMARGDAHRRC
jgi:hypothetical protein